MSALHAARPELLIKTWDEETVVFNPLSGETHLLNAEAAAALRVLGEAPMDARSLAAEVGRRMQLEASADLQGHMARLLWEFDELGLVQQIAATR